MSSNYTLPDELGVALYGDVSLYPKTLTYPEFPVIMAVANFLWPKPVEGDVFQLSCVPGELSPEFDHWLAGLNPRYVAAAWGSDVPGSNGAGYVSVGELDGHKWITFSLGGALSWAIPRAAVPAEHWDEFFRVFH